VNLAVLNHQKVAVKVLHQMTEEDNCQSVKLLVEFRNEIDILSQLNHPNLLLLKGANLELMTII
jgi:serine/threonine protein kinase